MSPPPIAWQSADALLVCGYNNYGQLGLGNTTNQTAWQASALPDGTRAKQVAGGFEHTAVLTEEGALLVCGANNFGQLGLGTTTDQSAWQASSLPGGLRVPAVACGWFHTILHSTVPESRAARARLPSRWAQL